MNVRNVRWRANLVREPRRPQTHGDWQATAARLPIAIPASTSTTHVMLAANLLYYRAVAALEAARFWQTREVSFNLIDFEGVLLLLT